MEYRQLGNLDYRVSVIGFGGWGIGGRTYQNTSYGETCDQESTSAIKQAIESGINYFDTSPAYGSSETLIGKSIADVRNQIIIATKVGYARWETPPNFSPSAIESTVTQSLTRLQTDYIDILQLHNPPMSLLRKDKSILKFLYSLIDNGIIKHWGISTKEPLDGVTAIEEFDANLVQVNFNMLDCRAIECGLFDVAQKRRVALVARTPLCFGFLTDRVNLETKFSDGDHRKDWSSEQIKRWVSSAQQIRRLLPTSEYKFLAQAALRYCFSFPEISTVIPSMLNPFDVKQNVSSGTLGTLPKEIIEMVLDIAKNQSLIPKTD